MRWLLSVVGTRGDVQPVLALAEALRELGHEPSLAIPPNFTAEAERLGFHAVPVGIEMRLPRPGAPPVAPPSVDDLVADQFAAVGRAAAGCDAILGANAHQYAARSIAEARGLPYRCALYAPTALPTPATSAAWTARAGARVATERAALGLGPVDDLLAHIVGDRPLLATDPALDPAPPGVVQTGDWARADPTPLPPAVARFLDAGEPPVYVGFGSMPTPGAAPEAVLAAMRALGRRAVLSRGWSAGALPEAADCLVVDEVPHRALFPRVAAVVHHGGAGTTHTAARAGVPQLVVPMYSDQPHWAQRVVALGLGATVPSGAVTGSALQEALAAALAASDAAAAFAPRVAADGAAVAARQLVS
ncbi:MAG: glycosyltransferase [Myxococcota bacterium]